MKVKIYKNPTNKKKVVAEDSSRRPSKKWENLKEYRASKKAKDLYGPSVRKVRVVGYTTTPQGWKAGFVPGNKDPRLGVVRSPDKTLENPRRYKMKKRYKKRRKGSKRRRYKRNPAWDFKPVLVPMVAGLGTTLVAEQLNKNLPANFQGVPLIMVVATLALAWMSKDSRDDNIKYALAGIAAITAMIVLNKLTFKGTGGLFTGLFQTKYGEKKNAALGGIVNRANTVAGIVNRANTMSGIVNRANTMSGIVNRANTMAGIVNRANTMAGVEIPQQGSAAMFLPQ